MNGSAPTHPRDMRGRMLSRNCPDPNCGGRLQWEPDTMRAGAGGGSWRCDGLTHERDDGPLEACTYEVLLPADEKSVQALLARRPPPADPAARGRSRQAA